MLRFIIIVVFLTMLGAIFFKNISTQIYVIGLMIISLYSLIMQNWISSFRKKRAEEQNQIVPLSNHSTFIYILENVTEVFKPTVATMIYSRHPLKDRGSIRIDGLYLFDIDFTIQMIKIFKTKNTIIENVFDMAINPNKDLFKENLLNYKLAIEKD